MSSSTDFNCKDPMDVDQIDPARPLKRPRKQDEKKGPATSALPLGGQNTQPLKISNKQSSSHSKPSTLLKGKGKEPQGKVKMQSTLSFKSEAAQPAASQRPLEGAAKRHQAGPSSSHDISRNAQTRSKLESPAHDLWVDKYAPQSVVALPLHKKKVEEVQHWLQQVDVTLQLGLVPTPRVLLLSGPPGAGKSTMLRVVAAEMGFEVCEWTEHRARRCGRASSSGAGGGDMEFSYDSRIDEFGKFLADSARTLALCLMPASVKEAAPSPTRKRLVLVEELPNVGSSPENTTRLQEALTHAVAVSRFPIALVISTHDTGTSTSTSSGQAFLNQLLQSTAVSGGNVVTHISCNPVANTLLKKTLQGICNAEGFALPEVVDSVVESCHGDLRHAVNSLQFYCTGKVPTNTTQPKAKGKQGTAGSSKSRLGQKQQKPSDSGHQAAQAKNSSEANTALSERDAFLDMFRVLGKLLHNKRLQPSGVAPSNTEGGAGSGAPSQGSSQGPSSSQSQGSHEALFQHHVALFSDAEASSTPEQTAPADAPAERGALPFQPEELLERSHLEPPALAAFLHQNYLDFFGDVEDIGQVVERLSEADCLVSYSHTAPWQTSIPAYAASVAARGVLWCNHNPAPRRFQQLRKPEVFAVDRARRQHKTQAGSLFCHPMLPNQLHTETLPFMRTIVLPMLAMGDRHVAHNSLTPTQTSFLLQVPQFATNMRSGNFKCDRIQAQPPPNSHGSQYPNDSSMVDDIEEF